MDKIEVAVIAEHGMALEMMGGLARLTQRGHNIKNMEDLKKLFESPVSSTFADALMKMELHGTIKRFAPITVAIVGASRRFLAQARTNQVGFTYVSASLQYSDYSGSADFVVPYALTEHDVGGGGLVRWYLESCTESMNTYREIAEYTDNDTAGYAAPQGLRNILIMQGNHEAWLHFLKTRTCNRNTNETQYVAFRIWEELLKTDGGKEMFKYAGPDCMYGVCREGKMCCGNPMRKDKNNALEHMELVDDMSIPRYIINKNWPLLGGETK